MDDKDDKEIYIYIYISKWMNVNLWFSTRAIGDWGCHSLKLKKKVWGMDMWFGEVVLVNNFLGSSEVTYRKCTK